MWERNLEWLKKRDFTLHSKEPEEPPAGYVRLGYQSKVALDLSGPNYLYIRPEWIQVVQVVQDDGRGRFWASWKLPGERQLSFAHIDEESYQKLSMKEAPMPGNLKLAFDFDDKKGEVRLSVVEDGCDPAYLDLETLDLSQTLAEIPKFVEEARAKWAVEPRFISGKKRVERRKPASAAEAELPEAEAYLYKVPAEVQLDRSVEEEFTAEYPDPNGVAMAVEGLAEPAEEVPAPQEPTGKFKYKVLNESGEVVHAVDVHAALRFLGISDEEISKHKYWHRLDRLPRNYRNQIGKVAV